MRAPKRKPRPGTPQRKRAPTPRTRHWSRAPRATLVRLLRANLITATLLALLTLPQLALAQIEAEGTLNGLGFGLPDEIATVRVDRFKELYPNVEFKLTEGSIDQQQLLTAIASGNPPDVIYLDRAELSTYATRGAIQPLGECLDRAGIDMSQFREAATDQVTVDGQVYGVPDFFSVIILMLNGDVLEEAGIDPADFNTSDWEQLSEWNDQLTVLDGNKLTRIGFDPKLPEFFPLWVRANGGQLMSDDGRTAQLNSPEAVEALEYTVKLHDVAGGRAPFSAFRDTWDFFGADNQIVQGQLAAFPIEQWYVNVQSDVAPDGPMVVKAFTDRQGNPLTFATGSAWAIPTGASNPDAACAFMATMSSPESWVAAAAERSKLREEAGATYTGTYTGNAVADEQIFGTYVKESGNQAFDDAVKVMVSVQDHAFAIPANPAGSEFKQAWTDAVNRVMNGEQTAQQALDQAQQEAQSALDKAWGDQ